MCVLAGAFALALAPSVRAADRKMVSFAWEWHRSGAKELLALQPQVAAAGYDGIGVDLRFPHREGTNTVWWGTSRGIMEQPDWDWDELAVELDDFRKLTGLDGFRECFVSGYRVPAKRFAWTDDASWGRISRKMTQLARYAKLAGFAGICIDHEDYTLQRQFEHLPDDPPMPEMAALARRRGRELVAGAFAEYPALKLWFFWFFSEIRDSVARVSEAGDAMLDSNFVLGNFLNGILDAMPPEARIIEGNECSYQFESGCYEYYRNAVMQRHALAGAAAPENREKYRTQVLQGSALYLDMYVQTNAASAWYRAPYAGSRLGMFRRDLHQALDACDGYVWTWSERNPIVKREKRAKWDRFPDPIWWNPTYDEKMPGFNRAIRAIKCPERFLAEDFPAIRASGALSNRISAVFTDRTPKWQEEMKDRSVGTFEPSKDGGRYMRVTGCSKGCVMPGISGCAAGEVYVLRIRVRNAGGGFWAYANYSGHGSRWPFFLPHTALKFSRPDAEGWQQGECVAVIPEGATTLSLVTFFRQNAGEKCYLSEPEIFKLEN